MFSDLLIKYHLRLSKDSLDSVLSYSKDRDIHSVGVVFLQMLHGQGVMQKFSTPREALQAGTYPLVSQFSLKKQNIGSVYIAHSTSYRFEHALFQQKVPNVLLESTCRSRFHVSYFYKSQYTSNSSTRTEDTYSTRK